MRRRRRGLNEWVDHRTGIQTAVRQFLYEEIPASSGWHQVFGSVAMFLFLVQAFTGALLAFNYAATPGDAYNSLRYILTELTAGRLMRGLHHWGASMMIVVVVLHMVQVFEISFLLSLMLVAIASINRPYQGDVHVSPEAFRYALETMDEPVPAPESNVPKSALPAHAP